VFQTSRGVLTPRAFTQRFASPPLTPIRLCFSSDRLLYSLSPFSRTSLALQTPA